MSIEQNVQDHGNLSSLLSPGDTDTPFPVIQYNDLPTLYRNGLSALGVVAGIFNAKGRLLTLRHNASRKLPQNALGLLSETSQHYAGEDSLRILETPPETLARAFQEELSVTPSGVTLALNRTGAWATYDKWPIGKAQPQKHALALVAFGHISRETESYIRDTFQPTEEIAGIDFTDPHELYRQPNLRAGTTDILAMALPQQQSRPQDQTILRLPPVIPRTDAHDAVYISNISTHGSLAA